MNTARTIKTSFKATDGIHRAHEAINHSQKGEDEADKADIDSQKGGDREVLDRHNSTMVELSRKKRVKRYCGPCKLFEDKNYDSILEIKVLSSRFPTA